MQKGWWWGECGLTSHLVLGIRPTGVGSRWSFFPASSETNFLLAPFKFSEDPIKEKRVD